MKKTLIAFIYNNIFIINHIIIFNLLFNNKIYFIILNISFINKKFKVKFF